MSTPAAIAHYRITSKLGEGGMGAVYRATDTKLNRDVAIKVLPDSLARDPERLARFEREAKVLASLNHPNIATIYSLEESPEGKAIAMELVDGATLQPPLPLDTALHYAVQIAEALEAAHEKAITHRDLKPANIMVTPSGMVKVLDFGLAAVARPAPANGANSPTLTMGLSEAGVILGTVAYMSPEQAVGHAVDRRTDVWAFGLVLWEMLSGRQVFTGETSAHILADVIRADIDFNKLPTTTPKPIRELLKRCLDRDLKSRLQWIGEARVTIQKYLAGDPAAGETSSARAGLRAVRGWAVSGALALALFAVTFAWFRQRREQPPLLRTSLVLPENLKIVPASGVMISPDGKHVAFVGELQGKQQIWLRPLDATAARSLPGTEDAMRIFWSPDSRSIGFRADGKLKRINIAGGPPISLTDLRITGGGTWSRDGVILSTFEGKGLARIPAGGGALSQVLAAPEGGFTRSPHYLPDGRHFLYTEGRRGSQASLMVGDLQGKTHKRLVATDSNAAYADPGYILYLVEGNLMAQPFDADKLDLRGDAVSIVEGVSFAGGPVGSDFSVSSNGMLVYKPSHGGGLILTWFDRTGKILSTIGTPGSLTNPAISPRGDRIAYNRGGQDGSDVWIYDIARGTETRLTTESGNDWHPVWSPDGSSVVYMTGGGWGASEHLFRRSSSGVAPEEDLGPAGFMAKDWSRDGRYILGDTAARATMSNDIRVLPMFGNREPFFFLRSEFREMHPKFSPGGDWVAYMSTQTGRAEVYLASFPEPKQGHRISISGGDRPVWSRDGREIYYLDLDGKIWLAEVKGSGPTLTTGAPRLLFQAKGVDSPREFDVTTDGRFLIPAADEESRVTTLILIQNWQALLKR